jgi:lipopolysaccharide transport system ATP-binding protein
LEKFIDTPVKRYSSGMYARLGFAVAAHVNPEILICDEVLSVGDGVFQKKCLGKMTSVRETEGTTVVFVSHNMVAVQNLCQRAIWLTRGEIVQDGPARDVVSKYLGMTADTVTERIWEDPTSAPGNEDVRLHKARAYPEHGCPGDPITTETPVRLEFDYWNLLPDNYLSLSLHLFNEDGVRILETSPVNETELHGRPFPRGTFRSVCRIPANLLNEGVVRVQLMVVKDQAAVTYSMDAALVFDVVDASDRRGGYLGKWEGVVRPDLPWETRLLQSG